MIDSLSTIDSNLAQYTSGQIMDAFTQLQNVYAQENQTYEQLQQWILANKNSLTPEGQQLYLSGLQSQGDAVNGLSQAITDFAVVLSFIGISTSGPGNVSVQGWRRPARMGIIPVVAIVAAIIVIVIGAVAWEAIQAHRDDAQVKIQQAKAMTQAQANVPNLIAAGWTPEQIQAYLQQQADANKPGVLEQIPWKTALIVGGVVLGIKAVMA